MSKGFKALVMGSTLFVTACDPAQRPGQVADPGAGVEQEPNSDQVSMPYCKRVEQVLTSADTPVGTLIPRQIALKASASGRGTWSEVTSTQQPFIKQRIVPSADAAPGEISVDYTNGAVRFIQSVPVDCSPGAECVNRVVSCKDSIEIDMQLSFSSDNGVFAETRVGTLSVPDPRDPDNNKGQGPGEQGGTQALPENPRVFKIQAAIDPIEFSGSASLQVELLQPSFKLSSNQVSLHVETKENKISFAGLGSLIEIHQSPPPEHGDGFLGAGSDSIYRFEPSARVKP